jgi:DNA-binding CsgD family transcriptional regulator
VLGSVPARSGCPGVRWRVVHGLVSADSWPLVGRGAEVDFVAGVLGGASAGCVVVCGAAGAGKTRVAREAVAAGAVGRSGRWAAGTSAAAGIPLGALAHLLPGVDVTASPTAVLAGATDALVRGTGASGARSRLVMGIDDAHLLDELSLALVHQWALTGAVSVVLTVGSGALVPSAVAALWKDGLAARLEVQALARGEVEQLITAVLGGIVHSETVERLWRVCRGNVLVLRELVEEGIATGRLTERGGVWRWAGPVVPGARLVEIVRGQWGPVDAVERAAMELVALGEPLAVGQLAARVGEEVVARLERRGLVTVAHSGRRREARLAHPVFAQVLRAEMPSTTARTLRRWLLDTLAGPPSDDPGADDFRPGLTRPKEAAPVWARGGVCPKEAGVVRTRGVPRARCEGVGVSVDREAGGLAPGGAARPGAGELLRVGRLVAERDDGESVYPLPPGWLAAAAADANATLEHDLAERLARAAVGGGADRECGGGVAAYPALQEAIRWRGRPVEAEHVGSVAVATASEPADRSRLVIGRALNLFFGLGRPGEAEAMLREAEAAPGVDPGHGPGSCITATRGVLAFLAGRPQEAAEISNEVLTSPRGASRPARAWAWAAAAAGLADAGRGAEALAAVASGRAECDRARGETELTMARLLLARGELDALLFTGRIHDARTRAAELHEASTADTASWAEPVTALHRGWTAMAAGHVRAALRWLTEAATDLERSDPAGCRPVCTALLVQAHALAGDAERAGSLLSDLTVARPSAVAVFEPQALLAAAWHASAEDRISDAVATARRAAASAAGMGQWAMEATALHAVVRLGRAATVADRLDVLVGQIDGPLVTAFAAQARAATAPDHVAGPRLDEVAAEFDVLGADLLAAEAAAAASHAHHHCGDTRRGAAAADAAARSARRCKGARTPGLRGLRTATLSVRERETATLAAGGMSNRAIAEHLVRSIRTVEAHLANAYNKLGVHHRDALVEALAAEKDH